MNKDIKKLFLIIVLTAASDGLFYNLLELWIRSNNMSISTSSKVLSLCAFLSVSVIFLCSNLIKTSKIKKFVSILFILRFVFLFSLFFLYQSNLNVLIKFLIMADYVTSVEITISMYPLISCIRKDDKIFAQRKLFYEISYYVFSLLTGLLIGKVLVNYIINYNTYTIFAAIFSLVSYVLLLRTNIPVNNKYEASNNLLFNLIRKIKKDNISLLYLAFVIVNNISFYSIYGMLITLLTNNFGLQPGIASNLKLLCCILAVIMATLILYKLTLKNNYINLGIKFVGRLICYLLVIINYNTITVLIALLYTVLTSSAYVHVVDAPYVNRFNNNEQFAFANLKEMLAYGSMSIGTFICGYGIVHGLKLIFIVSAILTFIGVIFGMMARYKLDLEALNDR